MTQWWEDGGADEPTRPSGVAGGNEPPTFASEGPTPYRPTHQTGGDLPTIPAPPTAVHPLYWVGLGLMGLFVLLALTAPLVHHRSNLLDEGVGIGIQEIEPDDGLAWIGAAVACALVALLLGLGARSRPSLDGWAVLAGLASLGAVTFAFGINDWLGSWDLDSMAGTARVAILALAAGVLAYGASVAIAHRGEPVATLAAVAAAASIGVGVVVPFVARNDGIVETHIAAIETAVLENCVDGSTIDLATAGPTVLFADPAINRTATYSIGEPLPPYLESKLPDAEAGYDALRSFPPSIGDRAVEVIAVDAACPAETSVAFDRVGPWLWEFPLMADGYDYRNPIGVAPVVVVIDGTLRAHWPEDGFLFFQSCVQCLVDAAAEVST
ncbi:MAG: hypothetical protein GY698_18120 [Actinomycetia bacterium]|nr:hypothetical protein [Actinomycetes bacterium]